MKKLKKILVVILALLGVIAIGIFIFIQTLKPTYDGEIKIAKLKNEVQIYYDLYGIPHIYGQSEVDAFRALFYLSV